MVTPAGRLAARHAIASLSMAQGDFQDLKTCYPEAASTLDAAIAQLRAMDPIIRSLVPNLSILPANCVVERPE